MNTLERLRSLTKPMTNAQVEAGLLARFGSLGRENVSSDDPILAARADRLVAKANSQQAPVRRIERSNMTCD
jgi:hypothetical protein